MDNFQEGYREQNIIVTSSNVLTAKVLEKISIINDVVTQFQVNLENGTDIMWNDVCFK